MTYTDIQNQFGDGVSVIGTAGTTFKLGDAIDLGEMLDSANPPVQLSQFVGDENALFARIRCVEQMITGPNPSATSSIIFRVVSGATSALNNAGTGAPVLGECTTHLTSLTIVTDDATDLATGINAGTATFLPNQTPNQVSLAGIKQTPIIEARLPTGPYKRWLGVLVTLGATAPTAGRVDAHLVSNVHQFRSYPSYAT